MPDAVGGEAIQKDEGPRGNKGEVSPVGETYANLPQGALKGDSRPIAAGCVDSRRLLRHLLDFPQVVGA